jgi:hypothetical protein
MQCLNCFYNRQFLCRTVYLPITNIRDNSPDKFKFASAWCLFLYKSANVRSPETLEYATPKLLCNGCHICLDSLVSPV